MSLLKCSLLIVVLLNSAFHNLLVNCIGCNGDAQVMLLSQRWPTTVCLNEGWNSNPACRLGNRWTLHGLWPDNVKVTAPENLSEAFLNTLSNNQGMENWPYFGPADQNSYMREAKTFWNHEWRKHGFCARNFIEHVVFTERIYFDTALRLYGQNNLFNTLNENGITPSNTVQYGKYQIERIFGYGNVFIVCRKVNRQYYLAEIAICMDQNRTPVSCKFAHSPGNNRDYELCTNDNFLYPV